MSVTPYKKWIIVFVIIYLILLVEIVIMENLFRAPGMFNYTTGNYWYDLLIILVLIPLFSIAGFFLGGYALTALFLFIHKKIFAKNYIYQIGASSVKKENRIYTKTLGPAFMAIHNGLSLINNTWIHEFIFNSASLTNLSLIYKEIIALFFLFPIISFISMMIYAAPFFLQDSGILYFNKGYKNEENLPSQMEVHSVGSWYLTVFSGFAGLSVLYDYLTIIIPYIQSVASDPILLYSNLAWLGMPFLIGLFMVPVILLQNFTIESRKSYVLKISQKFGIIS